MTSEQILKLVDECSPASDGKALWELNYQFAVFNERNAAMDEQNAELDAQDAMRRENTTATLLATVESLAQRLDALSAPRFPPGVPQ